MSQSMYQSSIAVFDRFLNNLSGILQKGAEFARDQGIEETALTSYRLYPNMFPLSRQVQIACDMAKGAGARLAGIEIPSFADTETTFEELQQRIAKTRAFLAELPDTMFDASADREIVLKLGEMTLEFRGAEYLSNWVLPNLFFHITTAYNILRHVGVDVGKRDFLGG